MWYGDINCTSKVQYDHHTSMYRTSIALYNTQIECLFDSKCVSTREYI